VIVARERTSLALGRLRDQGVRGARFSHRSGPGGNFTGSASFDDLLALAGDLADAGLHAELWTDCKVLPDIAARLRTLPIEVVIDHMGGFDVSAGIDEPGFRRLLSLVESGHAWVKLCAYRNLLAEPDFERGQPFHDELLKANPERLLWGSDWPHLRVQPPPDAACLLEIFKRWTGSERLVDQIG
jgi:predicted TIM-barrel fold metal-dependent hydrolase